MRCCELDPRLAERYGEVDWHALRGLRNRLGHGYEDLDRKIVRDVIERDLGGLLQVVRMELLRRKT